MQTQMEVLLENYQKLTAYCDQSFDLISARNRKEIVCKKGCDSCCILQSVSPFEGFIIRRYLQENSIETGEDCGEGMCPFLNNGSCSIYPVRPIICRTHGLVIRDEKRNPAGTCVLNYTGAKIEEVDSKNVLDMPLINDNLMRFNLAYCQITGQPEDVGKRILLKDLLEAQKTKNT